MSAIGICLFVLENVGWIKEEKMKLVGRRLGVEIGQAACQGPMARPTKSPVRPNSFNKWVKLKLFKMHINLIRPNLGL